MTPKTPKEKSKAPAKPVRQKQSGELDPRELDKVVGGLKRISDPCEGGE